MPQDLNQAKANKQQSTSMPKRPDNGGSEHPIDDASGALAKVTAGAMQAQVNGFENLVAAVAKQQDLIAEYYSDLLSDVLGGVRLRETTAVKTLEKLGVQPISGTEVEEESIPFGMPQVNLPAKSSIVKQYLESSQLPSRFRSIAAALESEPVASLPEQKGPQLPQI